MHRPELRQIWRRAAAAGLSIVALSFMTPDVSAHVKPKDHAPLVAPPTPEPLIPETVDQVARHRIRQVGSRIIELFRESKRNPQANEHLWADPGDTNATTRTKKIVITVDTDSRVLGETGRYSLGATVQIDAADEHMRAENVTGVYVATGGDSPASELFETDGDYGLSSLMMRSQHGGIALHGRYRVGYDAFEEVQGDSFGGTQQLITRQIVAMGGQLNKTVDDAEFNRSTSYREADSDLAGLIS